MNERTIRLRVGVVIFGTMLITAILIVINSDVSWSPFREQYQIQIMVDQAPGVAINTPVRRWGILIGRVAKVEDTDEGALITANIDQGKVIKTNEKARVQASLIGDASIEIVRGATEKDAPEVAPGARIIGRHSPNPMELIANMQEDLKLTVESLGKAGDEVAKLAKRFNTILGEHDAERLNRIVGTMETSMVQFGETMGHLNDILGDEQSKEQLKKGIAEMPLLISDAQAIMEGLQGVLGSADQNLENLQGLTRPLGERGDAIVRSLETSALNLQTLLGEVALLSKNLNSSEGTIGMLIQDRQFYDQVTRAVYDVRVLIAKVESMSRKLRPILDDVGVFTDKIARDPGRLLRDAAKRPTLIK